MTLESTRRPLTSSEQRLLQSRIRDLQARGRRGRAVAAPITGGVVLVLWVATLLASDAPPLVITAFWLVCGGGLAFWMRRDAGRDARSFEGMAAGLQSALKMNTADVYDVKARAFAEFDEVEDEGACFAFELSGNRLVFIAGQEFYESARFPSLDFSVVYVLDEAGRTVDMVIEKRGPKTKPARRIPASAKKGMEMPEHLEVRPGTIDGL
jgi:hypothetical protein